MKSIIKILLPIFFMVTLHAGENKFSIQTFFMDQNHTELITRIKKYIEMEDNNIEAESIILNFYKSYFHKFNDQREKYKKAFKNYEDKRLALNILKIIKEKTNPFKELQDEKASSEKNDKYIVSYFSTRDKEYIKLMLKDMLNNKNTNIAYSGRWALESLTKQYKGFASDMGEIMMNYSQEDLKNYNYK